MDPTGTLNKLRGPLSTGSRPFAVRFRRSEDRGQHDPVVDPGIQLSYPTSQTSRVGGAAQELDVVCFDQVGAIFLRTQERPGHRCRRGAVVHACTQLPKPALSVAVQNVEVQGGHKAFVVAAVQGEILRRGGEPLGDLDNGAASRQEVDPALRTRVGKAMQDLRYR